MDRTGSRTQPSMAADNSHPARLGRRTLLAWLAGVSTLFVACGRKDAPPEPTPAPTATTAPTPQANRARVVTGPASRMTQSGAPNPAPQETVLLSPTPTPSRPTLPERLVIPRIELDIPVVELGWSTNHSHSGSIFSEWDVAAHAAGWHKNSALPGHGGNIVMSGHNNILGAVFRQLDQLRRDDEITVYIGADVRRYRVERVLIVPEKHATEEQRVENGLWIAPTTEERLTLVSCWPRNDNTHRIIVVAKPQV